MSDLVEFLRARLDDRAARARAAMHGGEGRWTQVDPDRHPGQVEDETREIVIYDEGRPSEEQAAHIAENDPARVLREVESKRRIIDEHEAGHDPCDAHDASFETIPCDTLRLLALPHADHPDYRKEWRP